MYIRNGRLVGYGPSFKNFVLCFSLAFHALFSGGISLYDWRMMHIIVNRPHVIAHVDRAWTESVGKSGYMSFADVSFILNDEGTIKSCKVEKLFLGYQKIEISKFSVAEIAVVPGGCYDPIAVVAYPLFSILTWLSFCVISSLVAIVIWRQS